MQEQEQYLKKINPINQQHSGADLENYKQNHKLSSKVQLKQKQSKHDHQHDQNCTHNENDTTKNKKDNKIPKKKINKNYAIIIYCIFTCLSCFYLEVYCFHQFEQNQHKRRIKSFFTVLVVIMALWSYFQTIITKNNFVKVKGVPNVNANNQTEQNFLSKYCQHCKYHKPPLVSHCSTCGTCIMKLDHHCLWAQNCVGYRNHKCFYLFTLYMSIGLYQFWTATILTVSKLYGSCKFFSFFEPGVYILWAITCFSALVVGIMIVSLLFGHTIMILTNHTTLMSVKKSQACPMPFCEFRNTFLNDQSINEYDRGEIQNMRTLFGTNIFFVLLPFTREIEHDFLFQPANPIPTKIQIASLENNELKIKRNQISIEKCKQQYKGKKLQINNKIFEI